MNRRRKIFPALPVIFADNFGFAGSAQLASLDYPHIGGDFWDPAGFYDLAGSGEAQTR
jgi:hypothetical protein